MLLSKSLIWLGLAVSSVVAAPVDDGNSFSQAQQDNGDAMLSLSQKAYNNAMSMSQASRQKVGGCTPDKIKVRKEWYVANRV